MCSLIGPGAGCDSDVDLISPAGTLIRSFADGAEEMTVLSDGSTIAGYPAGAPFVVRRFDEKGRIDRDFGHRGRTVRWAGVEGGQLTDLAPGPPGTFVASAQLDRARHAVARLELTDGPPDKDADGIVNRHDRCPAGYGRAPAGCRAVDQELTLSRVRGATLRGRLSAANTTCTIAARIEIFRHRPGSDGRIARLDDNSIHPVRYTRVVRRPGRYYAVAPEHYSDRGRCTLARTASVTVHGA